MRAGFLAAVAASRGDHITIAHPTSPATLALVPARDTTPEAGPMTLDAARDRIYTAAVRHCPAAPRATSVLAGRRRRGLAVVAGSFHVLVHVRQA